MIQNNPSEHLDCMTYSDGINVSREASVMTTCTETNYLRRILVAVQVEVAKSQKGFSCARKKLCKNLATLANCPKIINFF